MRATFAILTAAVIYGLGGLDMALSVLLWVMGLDILSGVIAALAGKRLHSDVWLWGLLKKGMGLVLVALAYQLGLLFDAPAVRMGVIYALIGWEGLSIIENAAELNLPIPQVLRDALAKLHEKPADNPGPAGNGVT